MKDICFGVDLGGTTAKIGIFNDNGLLIDKWEISTRTEENGRYILEDIAASLNKAVAVSYTHLDVYKRQGIV